MNDFKDATIKDILEIKNSEVRSPSMRPLFPRDLHILSDEPVTKALQIALDDIGIGRVLIEQNVFYFLVEERGEAMEKIRALMPDAQMLEKGWMFNDEGWRKPCLIPVDENLNQIGEPVPYRQST